MSTIIPSVKRRNPWLRYSAGWYAPVGDPLPIPDWLSTGGILGPVEEPEPVRRQREMLRAMEAEALALWRIEQKHPKRIEDKS